MGNVLSTTAIIAIAAGGGGIFCFVGALILFIFLRRRLIMKTPHLHDIRAFRQSRGYRWQCSNPEIQTSVARPSSPYRSLQPSPSRAAQIDWAVCYGSHVPRPRLLRKIRNSFCSPRGFESQHGNSGGRGSLKRFSSVHVRQTKISGPSNAIQSPSTPEQSIVIPKKRKAVEAYGSRRGPGFHIKSRSISSSAVEMTSQSPNWRSLTPRAAFGKTTDNLCSGVQRSWSMQYGSSSNVPTSSLPTPPTTMYHSRDGYVYHYDNSPSRNSTISRTTVCSSILNGDFLPPTPQEQPYPPDTRHYLLDQAKSPGSKGSRVRAGLHLLSPRRHEADVSIPLPIHPALRRAKPDAAALPLHKKSISPDLESLIQSHKQSSRTSKTESQLFDLLRDESSSLSPSLVNSSISPCKALEDRWMQQHKTKEATPKISTREAPLINFNEGSNDPYFRKLREATLNREPPSWTIKIAQLDNQDAKQVSKDQIMAAETELQVFAVESKTEHSTVDSSLMTPKQKRQRSNTQRISLVVPVKALDVEELRGIARQESTAESALTHVNTHHGTGDPQVQIAKPKPLRPGKRPLPASVFDPKIATSDYSDDSNVTDARPVVIHSTSLPSVLNAVSSTSSTTYLSTTARSQAYVEEYDPTTPTMNPSKRRSQVDPHRLSNVTNPPIHLEPAPRMQSSPFSFERTSSYVYRTQIVSLGNTSIDEEPGLSASPPPESMQTSPKSEDLTPLDQYRHLFDRFPPPVGTSLALPPIQFPKIKQKPPLPKSQQRASNPTSPSSPRLAPKTLPSPISKITKQPKARARKRRSHIRSSSPLRNVLAPSFEWHPPNAADDIWTTKLQNGAPQSSEVGSPSPDPTAGRTSSIPPRTLHLVNQLRRMNSEYDSDDLFHMLETDVKTPQTVSNPTFSPLGMNSSQFSFEGYDGEETDSEIGVARTCWDSVMEFEQYPSSSNRNESSSTSIPATVGARPRSTGGTPDSKGHSDELSPSGRELQERTRAEVRSSRGEAYDYAHLERLYGQDKGRGSSPLVPEEREMRIKEESVSPLSTGVRGNDRGNDNREGLGAEIPTSGHAVAAISSSPLRPLPGLLQESEFTVPGLNSTTTDSHAGTPATSAPTPAHGSQRRQQQQQQHSQSPFPLLLPLAPLPLNTLSTPKTSTSRSQSRLHRQSQSFSQFQTINQTHKQVQAQAQLQTETWTHTRPPHAPSSSTSGIFPFARDSRPLLPLPNYYFHQQTQGQHNQNQNQQQHQRPFSPPVSSSWGNTSNAKNLAFPWGDGTILDSNLTNGHDTGSGQGIHDSQRGTGNNAAESILDEQQQQQQHQQRAFSPGLDSVPGSDSVAGRSSSFDPRVVGLGIGMLGRELELGI